MDCKKKRITSYSKNNYSPNAQFLQNSKVLLSTYVLVSYQNFRRHPISIKNITDFRDFMCRNHNRQLLTNSKCMAIECVAVTSFLQFLEQFNVVIGLQMQPVQAIIIVTGQIRLAIDIDIES